MCLTWTNLPYWSSFGDKVEERCLTVPGRFESLSEIAEFVTSMVREAGWDEHEIFHVQMAVDEACSNIIEHAYGQDKAGEVTLTCCVETQGDLVIKIHDHGKPFDPASVPEPAIGVELENLPEGGLGLYFMRKLMDEVTFRFDTKHGNELTMVKRRPK